MPGLAAKAIIDMLIVVEDDLHFFEPHAGAISACLDLREQLRRSPEDRELCDHEARTRALLDATSDWQRVATDNGVAASELPRFTDTFEGLRGPLERLTAATAS